MDFYPRDFGLNDWQLESFTIIDQEIFFVNNIPAGELSLPQTQIIRVKFTNNKFDFMFFTFNINPDQAFGISGISNLKRLILTVAHQNALREYVYNADNNTFDQIDINEFTGNYYSYVKV
jgi:hypothetical protein